MPGSVLSVCVPAPSEGVFVEAPEKIPSTAAGSKPASQPISGAPAAPRSTIAAASDVQFHALLPQRREKAGTELEADGEDEQDQSELLHEIERVMIDRFAEVPDEDTRKEHARRAESDAAELQLPSAIPTTQTNASTPMACAIGCVLWSSKSQFTLQATGAAPFTSALAPAA